MNKYVFRRYSPVFKGLFIREKKRLASKLGTGAHIEHIGSTAVPGLGGKNILDILVGARRSFSGLKKRLTIGGFEFVRNAGSHDRLFFFRDCIYLKKRMRIHLHLVRYGGREWKEKVAFRNFLVLHRDAAKEYTRIKKRAAKLAKGSKKVYLSAKEKFIKRATKKALREYR